LNTLAPAQVDVKASIRSAGSGDALVVTLTNTGDSVAFFLEVTALDRDTGRRIAPIFWSDNYLTLLPGECQTIETRLDHSLDQVKVRVRGWNT
jgi:exo-1,4-beta-D-glucosaminidase